MAAQQHRVLNCIPSRDRENDWLTSHADAAGVLAPVSIPDELDRREDWWHVADQTETGSCVGWATADSVLRWHFVQSGQLARDERLSVRYLWMAAKEVDQFTTRPTTFIEVEGTSVKAALDIARKYGVVRESVLPFDGGKLFPGNAQAFYAVASRLMISSYYNLGSQLSEWRRWLASQGPIVTRLDVDATWDAATANGGRLDAYRAETRRGGHAVALVGYTRDAFIVRNSWGTGWGDNGFAYASEAYAQAAFGREAYGVVL